MRYLVHKYNYVTVDQIRFNKNTGTDYFALFCTLIVLF